MRFFLWPIVIENFPLFQDQFFELFSVQVLIQYYAWIVPNAKFVSFNVVVSNVTIVILLSKT